MISTCVCTLSSSNKRHFSFICDKKKTLYNFQSPLNPNLVCLFRFIYFSNFPHLCGQSATSEDFLLLHTPLPPPLEFGGNLFMFSSLSKILGFGLVFNFGFKKFIASCSSIFDVYLNLCVMNSIF